MRRRWSSFFDISLVNIEHKQSINQTLLFHTHLNKSLFTVRLVCVFINLNTMSKHGPIPPLGMVLIPSIPVKMRLYSVDSELASTNDWETKFECMPLSPDFVTLLRDSIRGRSTSRFEPLYRTIGKRRKRMRNR